MKYYLIRVRLNSQGYESDGTYWGVGLPLYRYFSADSNGSYIRAYDREDAKERIRQLDLQAKFFV